MFPCQLAEPCISAIVRRSNRILPSCLVSVDSILDSDHARILPRPSNAVNITTSTTKPTMSLRFLTKRRDRLRSDSDSKQATLDKSPVHAPHCIPLPSSDLHFIKGKMAPVPSEVQVISWHPDHLRASGRQVHIQSRRQETCTSVLQTSTIGSHSASASASMPIQPRTTNSAQHDTRSSTASATDSAHTLVHLYDPPTHLCHTCHHPNRSGPGSGSGSPSRAALLHKHSASVPLATHPASDTSKSQHVQLPDPLSCAPPHMHQQDLPLAPTKRHSKSRSYTPTVAANDTQVLHHISPPPFALLYRNASTQCITSLSSYRTDGAPKDPRPSPPPPPRSSSVSSSSSLLSRLYNLRKTKSKTALLADVDRSTPVVNPTQAESTSAFRSRSDSFSSLSTRPARSSKDSLPPTPSPSRPNRAARATNVPPSAWRTDSASTPAASNPDKHAAAKSKVAATPSLAYSSDNEPSLESASSSSGHRPDSGGAASASFSRHSRTASSGDASTTATSLLFASLKPLGGGVAGADPISNRISTHSARSAASPAHANSPLLHLDQPSPVLDSPQVAGLLLPLPTSSSTSSFGGTMLTAHLLKRIGPPPVGLPPDCFQKRVSLIHNYILSQVPSLQAVLPPSPFSQPSDEDLSGVYASANHPSHRSSLTLSPRYANTTLPNARLSTAPALTPLGSTPLDPITSLQDEFDKLECLAEAELRDLASSNAAQHRHVETIAILQELRLEEAFREARRRCGVNCVRSHFDLTNLTPSDANRHDACRGRVSVAKDGASSLGLAGSTPRSAQGASLEMSLKPAPRKRRGIATVRRPFTAPGRSSSATTTSFRYAGLDLPATIQDEFKGELFTPQSFAKPLAIAPLQSAQPSNGGIDDYASRSTTGSDDSRKHGSVGSASTSIPVWRRSPVLY